MSFLFKNQLMRRMQGFLPLETAKASYVRWHDLMSKGLFLVTLHMPDLSPVLDLLALGLALMTGVDDINVNQACESTTLPQPVQ